MQDSSGHNDKRGPRQSQVADFFKAIFGQQAGGFLGIRVLSEPGQPPQLFFPLPSELNKAAALAVSLKNHSAAHTESQQQPFSTEVPSPLNTSAGPLLGGAPCHASAG